MKNKKHLCNLKTTKVFYFISVTSKGLKPLTFRTGI
jgi:hypothetical protein